MSKDKTSKGKVDALMAGPKKAGKSRRTLYLNDANYKRLEKVTSEKGRSPSEIVDALIEDFLESYG